MGLDGRVTVFDTQSKWRTPVYEDIARFLVSLHASGPQMSSLGLMYDAGLLAMFEREFLRGNFADAPVPRTAIPLFEIQHLLAMWVSLVHHHQKAKGSRRIVKRFCLSLWTCFVAQRIKSLLGQLPDNE